MWWKIIFVFSVVIYSAGASCPTIISRSEWHAREGESIDLGATKPTHVIIHHSETAKCTTKDDCSAIVKSLQKHHIDINNWKDIAYNFLIGEDGNVYEGVGWGKSVNHVPQYYQKTLEICIIGDYTSWLPNEKALTALDELLDCAASTDRISANYRLLGHKQLDNKSCPGTKLYDYIRRKTHWKAA